MENEKNISDWDKDLTEVLEEFGTNKSINAGWRETFTILKRMWGLPQNYMPMYYPNEISTWQKIREAN